MKNTIIIHAAPLYRCEERLKFYLDNIQKYELYKYVNTIFISFVGNIIYIDKNEYSLELIEKIKYIKISDNIEDYELPTLKFLYDYSCNNEDKNILYLHTKAIGNEINPCLEDWVKYMIYFLVEKWKYCILLLENNSTCGVDLRDIPTLHYSGNFWWAKASYIKTLPDPLIFNDLEKYPNPLNSIRHNQEFWICFNKDKNLHNSLWDCGINCYERHLHRYPFHNYSDNKFF
jgi:hypothetical protein